MPRVPFNTDKEKKKYLKQIAIKEICFGCKNFGYCKNGGIPEIKEFKRNVVREAQDLFEVKYVCSQDNTIGVNISKFFLPNNLFEDKYIENVINILDKDININGKKILDELLRWGKLQVKN